MILFGSVALADPTVYTDENVPSSGTVSTTNGVIFDITNSATFGGALNGSGAVSKIGDGKLTLSGTEDIGINYTGTMTVSKGEVYVEGYKYFGAEYKPHAERFIVEGIGTTLSTTTYNPLRDLTLKNGATLYCEKGYDAMWGSFILQGTVKITTDDGKTSKDYAVTFDGSGDESTFIGLYNSDTVQNVSFEVDNVTGDFNSDLIVNVPLKDIGIGHKDYRKYSSLTKTGSGTMELTVANAYSLGTILSAGTLKLTGDGTLGGGSVSIAGNGTLEFAHTADKTFSNVFSGSGNINKTGEGKLTLNGEQVGANYTGTFTVSNGELCLAGTKYFGREFDAHDERVIVDGTGAKLSTTAYNPLRDLTLKNGSTLYCEKGADATWGSFVLQGTVKIKADEGKTSKDYAVTFDGSGDASAFIGLFNSDSDLNVSFEVDNVTGDSNSDLIVNVPLKDIGIGAESRRTSRLTKTGSGTMELTATNAYTLGTILSEGTLKLSGDGTLGTGSTTIADGVKLEFSVGSGEIRKIVFGADKTDYDRFYTITGTGSSQIVKSGNGDLKILLQAQGQVTAEEFLVSSGRLDVMSVMYDGNNYAALDADIRVLEGATFSPGNSVGYVDVNGNVILESGSQFLLEVSKDNSGNVSYDTWSTEDNYTIFNEGSFLSIVIDDESEKSFSPYESLTITLPKNIQYQGKDEATSHAITSDEMQKVLNSYYFNFTNYDPATGTLQVYTDPNAVPEPSTWALLILGIAGLMWYRKRGRR